MKEFDENMGKEECARHMEELKQIASRVVTKEDVHVSANEVVGASMRWISLIFTLVAGSLVVALRDFNVLLDFFVALGLHVADNKFTVSRRTSRFVNLAWFALWMLLQLLVSYGHEIKLEIPQGILMIGYMAAVTFACIESISGGPQDSAWSMRQRQDKSIMEV